jgi:hypothetical protein
MFKALSEGHRNSAASRWWPTRPIRRRLRPCRQILWEFGGDLEVILANLRVEKGRHKLSALLRCRSTRDFCRGRSCDLPA